MNGHSTPHISIDWIAKKASVWAFVATTFFVTIFAFVALLQEMKSRIDEEERRLTVVAPAITRSIAGELLVGDERSLSLLQKELKRQFGLTTLELSKDAKTCDKGKTWWKRLVPSFETCLVVPLKEISSSANLVLRSQTKEFGWASGLSVVLWFCVPLILFGVFTTYRIRRELERSIVEPIKKLAKDPENWDGQQHKWVAQETVTLHKKLRNYIKERDAERDKALTFKTRASMGEMAAQVAHDIRSPLAALDMLATSMKQLPEDKRVLMRSALARIRDIANGLLDRHRATVRTEKAQTVKTGELPEAAELLSSLVDTLISEKRLQYRARIGVQIDISLSSRSYGLFAAVQPTEFKRVLSNVIDNAVEAVGESGRVAVELYAGERTVNICIVDNGKGVSKEKLPTLMERGQSFGKKEGAGLGLFHARTTVESWGGRIRIESELGKGTEVEISLPRAPIPRWFVPQILLARDSNVVVLDDDTSIHHIWEGRFKSLRLREKSINVLHFSSGQETENWFREDKRARESDVYLIDYELVGESANGLDLIKNIDVASRSILVTSRFEEPSIRARCEQLSVPLLPKSLAGFVPIVVGNA